MLIVFLGCDSSALEVGPQPQGVVRADIFNVMKQGVDAILDWTETFNSGMSELRWNDTLEVHFSVFNLFFIGFPIFSPIFHFLASSQLSPSHVSYQLKANISFIQHDFFWWKALSTLFHIQELTDAHNWLVREIDRGGSMPLPPQITDNFALFATGHGWIWICILFHHLEAIISVCYITQRQTSHYIVQAT